MASALWNNWGSDTSVPSFRRHASPAAWQRAPLKPDVAAGSFTSTNWILHRTKMTTDDAATVLKKKRHVQGKEKGASPEPVVWNAAFNGWLTCKCAVTWDGWKCGCPRVHTQTSQRAALTFYIASLWRLPRHWIADSDWWDVFFFSFSPSAATFTDQ